jgi:hypothetical protein
MTNNKIYAFGDSYTKGHGCLENEEFYNKYKHDESDKIWCDIVSEKLGMELINFGVGLYSNDKIIDSIISIYDLFKKNDIVLIQKTFSHRFDIPNIHDNKLITVSPGNIQSYDSYTKEEIEKILYLSDSELYKKRQNLRFDFLSKILKNNDIICVVWDVMDYLYIERIVEHTNGEIFDHHWSFNGHKEMSDNMLKLIKNNNLYEANM